MSMAENIERPGLLKPNTKMLWIESSTNPLLRIVDIEAVVQIAKRIGALSIVDNTFATPSLQSPLPSGKCAILAEWFLSC